jgi:hypothetical protein
VHALHALEEGSGAALPGLHAWKKEQKKMEKEQRDIE